MHMYIAHSTIQRLDKATVIVKYAVPILLHVMAAIPNGNSVSGPRLHQFFAMSKFDHYWYYACIIPFKVHLKAYGSGFRV